MSAGLPKYITVNLSTLGQKFTDGEEVSLESLTQKRMLNLSGREAKLPLKVLRQFCILCIIIAATAYAATFLLVHLVLCG